MSAGGPSGMSARRAGEAGEERGTAMFLRIPTFPPV